MTKAAIQLHHTFIESNICNEIFSYLEEPDEIVPIAIDDCVLGIDGLAGVVKILNKQKASVDKHIEHLTQKQRKNKERLTRLDKISS